MIRRKASNSTNFHFRLAHVAMFAQESPKLEKLGVIQVESRPLLLADQYRLSSPNRINELPEKCIGVELSAME